MKFNANAFTIILLTILFIIFQFRTNFWERDYDAFGLFMIMAYFIFILGVMQMKTLKNQKNWFYIFSVFMFLIFLLTAKACHWKEMPVILGLILVPIISVVFGIRFKKGVMLGKKEGS